jgi:hypothetical protein
MAAVSEAPKLIALKSSPKKTKEVVPLFSIDGKEYSVPAEARANDALAFMHISRVQGEAAGIDYMLEAMLGTEGYTALMQFDDLTQDDLENIIKIASEIMMGALESPKTKSSNGSEK